MARLLVRVRAPFAAFRGMQAGVYRTTAPVMPYSAAWGLVLNLAGVETRKPANPTTLIDPHAPALRLAIAAVSAATADTLYQQLHAYPVGTSFPELKAKTKGAKYAIQPIRREILVGLDCLVGVQGDDDLIDRIQKGVNGQSDRERYGLPFAGDNNLLIDRIDILDDPLAARWYVPLTDDDPPRPGSCRLTVSIDRADSSRTTAVLCAPGPASTSIPDAAWIWTPHEPSR